MCDKNSIQESIEVRQSKRLVLTGMLILLLLAMLFFLFFVRMYTVIPSENKPKSSIIEIGWVSVLDENDLSRYGIPMKEYRVRIKRAQSVRDYFNYFEHSVYIPLDTQESNLMVIANDHSDKFFEKEVFIVMYQPAPVRGIMQPQIFFVKLKNYHKGPSD